MIFKDRVSFRNTVKHTDFLQCFSVSVSVRNTPRVTHCFFTVFQCFKCFPLKGAANTKHAVSGLPLGDGRRV